MDRCYHHARSLCVRFKQWHGDEESGLWEESSRYIKNNSPLDMPLLVKLQKYYENGTVLLDLVETDLHKITMRVAEQMVFDGLIGQSEIKNVSELLLSTHHSNSQTSLASKERKQDAMNIKDPEVSDIKTLSTTLNLQSESHYQFTEAALVMVGNFDFIQKPTTVFIRLKTAVYFPEKKDHEFPVRFLVIFFGPMQESHDYFEIGKYMCTILCDEDFCVVAYNAKTKSELVRAFASLFTTRQTYHPEIIVINKVKEMQEEEEHNHLLNGEKNDKGSFDPLIQTHRLWGGLINDITRRIPYYKSDIVDGLNRQTIAASLFLYFGVMSTTVTFGGLLSSKTENLMGISETLLSTSMVGIVFHLLSSQPLLIIGGTGPLLLFDEALFQLCKIYEFDFLTVRIYIGLWLGLIAVAIAAFDGCVYLRLLTRFTQELFASLISLIFMMEAIFKVIDVFKTHPILYENKGNNTSIGKIDVDQSDDTITSEILINREIGNRSNTALFCAILLVGTFVLAYCLRVFRNSHFFGRSIRRAIGDFGVPISISAFVYLSYLAPQIYTEKLIVPEGISPTNPNARSWLIAFNALPIWVPFISAIAAMLVYVLIFMETQISELLLHSRGLKKGSGFHVDIVIICLVNVVCGFLGMPWQSGATIRSVTHVSAVTVLSDQGGKSQTLVIQEQRISGLMISMAVGLSVVMAPILRIIPVSVLYGVFFYMGVVSISGVQFLHRVRLMFTPTKYHGTQEYVQRVPTWKMHLFTSVQILALGVLWLVKSSQFSLALPFVLLLMIPLQMKVSSYFSTTEMDALDGNLPTVIDVNDEPDFYQQSHLPA